MRILSSAGIAYTVKEYPVNESALSALHVAEYLEIPAEQVFKTLVLQGASGACTVCCIASSTDLDLKKTAKATGEKSIALIPVKDILPLTGYVRGGCSPIGMKKSFVTTIDESAAQFETIIFSAGKIGFQLEMKLEELHKAIRFQQANITV